MSQSGQGRHAFAPGTVWHVATSVAHARHGPEPVTDAVLIGHPHHGRSSTKLSSNPCISTTCQCQSSNQQGTPRHLAGAFAHAHIWIRVISNSRNLGAQEQPHSIRTSCLLVSILLAYWHSAVGSILLAYWHSAVGKGNFWHVTNITWQMKVALHFARCMVHNAGVHVQLVTRGSGQYSSRSGMSLGYSCITWLVS
jgi:hypothetical protein